MNIIGYLVVDEDNEVAEYPRDGYLPSCTVATEHILFMAEEVLRNLRAEWAKFLKANPIYSHEMRHTYRVVALAEL